MVKLSLKKDKARLTVAKTYRRYEVILNCGQVILTGDEVSLTVLELDFKRYVV